MGSKINVSLKSRINIRIRSPFSLIKIVKGNKYNWLHPHRDRDKLQTCAPFSPLSLNN